MVKANVAVNGYGTIGKRVVDAMKVQDDMEIVGVSKTKTPMKPLKILFLNFTISVYKNKLHLNN